MGRVAWCTSFDGCDVTVDIVLLLVLMVPIALWAVLRWLPERREKAEGRTPAPSGPRKRWWQP